MAFEGGLGKNFPLPERLPKVRKRSSRELKHMSLQDRAAHVRTHEESEQREQTRKALARHAKSGGLRPVESDGSKPKLSRPKVQEYKALRPLEKPDKPNFSKIADKKVREAARVTYNTRLHAYRQEKRRRDVVKEYMTRGGIFSVAKQAEDVAQASRTKSSHKKRGPIRRAVNAGMAGLTLLFQGLNVDHAVRPQTEPVYSGQVNSERGQAERTPELKGPEWAPVPFETAFRYAERAEQLSGVPSDLILSVVAQETGIDFDEGTLGHEVGECYITNLATGDGIRIRNGEHIPHVMNAARDGAAFQQLTAELGLDPMQTPVSCPAWDPEQHRYFGYGGALGFTQTRAPEWLQGSEQIQRALGKEHVSPWNMEDAITRTGFILKENGATEGPVLTPAETRATGLYYAGANWRNASQAYTHGVENYRRQIGRLVGQIREQDARGTQSVDNHSEHLNSTEASFTGPRPPIEP